MNTETAKEMNETNEGKIGSIHVNQLNSDKIKTYDGTTVQ